MSRIDRAHHSGRERRDRDRHPEPEHGHRRKERRPIGAANSRPRVQREAEGSDARSYRQRKPTACSRDQCTRPSGQHEHDDRKRQQSRSGGRCCVVLDLNEIERHEKQDDAQRGV